MKNTLTLFLLLFTSLLSIAQEGDASFRPKIIAKWAPTGLILGSASFQAEYSFSSKNSLTAKIGLPAQAHHTFQYQDQDADFNMKATSFLAGYRTYLSKKRLAGLYFEPFFKYVYHNSEGRGSGPLNGRTATFQFSNAYTAAGVGVQLGAQFRVGNRLVIDLFFFGPEINSASNAFKAVEVSNTIMWSEIDAMEAEKNIREFLNQFPFIRNRVNVMVDRENKRVNADFKGALPGVRTGLSIGFVF